MMPVNRTLPLSVRWRAWRSQLLLSTCGVSLNHRTARWLAASAVPRLRTDGQAALDAPVAQLALRLERGKVSLHESSLSRRAARLAASRDVLERAVRDAEVDVARAVSEVPDGAIDEPPSFGLRVALGAVLLAESALTFEGIQAWAPGEPLVALAVALVLAPALVATVAQAGSMWRRRAWGFRLDPVERAIGIVALLVAGITAGGLAIGRVHEATSTSAAVADALGPSIPFYAVVLTSAGFQATLLVLAFLHGYRHATASGPLQRARARLHIASRRLATNQASCERLVHLHAWRLDALKAQHAATEADLRAWYLVFAASIQTGPRFESSPVTSVASQRNA